MVVRCRKKPIETEAMQVPDPFDIDNRLLMEDWLRDSPTDRQFLWAKGGLIIQTLEGQMIAKIGDYVVKGIKGEFWPVRKDIFEETYDIL